MYLYYHLVRKVIYIHNSPLWESIKYKSKQRKWPLHFYASEHAILHFVWFCIWPEMLKYMYAVVIQLHCLPRIEEWHSSPRRLIHHRQRGDVTYCAFNNVWQTSILIAFTSILSGPRWLQPCRWNLDSHFLGWKGLNLDWSSIGDCSMWPHSLIDCGSENFTCETFETRISIKNEFNWGAIYLSVLYLLYHHLTPKDN